MTDIDIINLLSSEFTNEDEIQFVKHFHLYLNYGASNDFVISLDDVWIWCGFYTKGSAKRSVMKYMKQDTDYVLNRLLNLQVKQTRGGHNKESIMVTVDAFKTLCMIANTEKGKLTRQYYLRMEKVFFMYMKATNSKLVEELESKTKKQIELDRHNTLKNAYKDTPCIYLIKVYDVDESNYTIKLGETDDIVQRISTIRRELNQSSIILDIFPCQRPHKFEQFLLNCPIIKHNRINGTELIRISTDFTYDKLINTIKRNIDFFNTTDINICYETQKSKELTVLLQNIQSCDDQELKEMMMKRYKQLLGEEKAEAIEETYVAASTRKVYQYIPNNIQTPIAAYSSMREAARSLGDVKIHDYHIREACENATIFKNYRWLCVDGDDKIPENIPQNRVLMTNTVASKPRRQGLVAQLNFNKETILKVYSNQKIAAEDINVRPCSLTSAITSQRKCGGYYWMMYEDCNAALKSTFDGIIPNVEKPATCSKAICCYDPYTNTIVETYNCIQDIVSKFKTCHKSIHKACQSGYIFKNLIWKYV